MKARELMLEDLTESIKFYVEEQPLDLVYNINKKYKWVVKEIKCEIWGPWQGPQLWKLEWIIDGQ